MRPLPDVLQAIFNVMPGKERGQLKRALRFTRDDIAWCPPENSEFHWDKVQEELQELLGFDPTGDWQLNVQSIFNGRLDYRDYLKEAAR